MERGCASAVERSKRDMDTTKEELEQNKQESGELHKDRNELESSLSSAEVRDRCCPRLGGVHWFRCGWGTMSVHTYVRMLINYTVHTVLSNIHYTIHTYSLSCIHYTVHT